MRPVAVLDGNDRRDRAERVTGRQVQRERRIAERQRLAIGRHHVALCFRPSAGIGLEQIPVRLAQNDVGTKLLLQVSRASHVIAVCVADEDVLDRCGV